VLGIRKRIVHEDNKLIVVKEQNFSRELTAIREAREMLKPGTGMARGRWLGSIPRVLADTWAHECGKAVGTREFNKYAAEKLKSNEFRNLRGTGG
jgi:hypothetical protein